MPAYIERDDTIAVLRSKRNVAKSEFENTFTKLYHYSAENTGKVAKRRQKWLAVSIDELMNDSYNIIMEISESSYCKSKDKDFVENNVRKVLRNLYDLQDPLLILWDIEHYETKKMVTWCNHIQSEFDLLLRLIDLKFNYKFRILDHKAIENVKFLKNMSELHIFIHGKVIHAPKRYDGTSGQLLIDLVDSAFLNVVKANNLFPSTQKEFAKRRKYLTQAISDLYKLQRQTLFYCNLMQYSEAVIKEWFTLVSTEIKLLQALKKSDKRRFKDLK